MFEGYLSLIFSAIVGLGEESLPASRAYGSVVAFTGRASMLRAAAEAYFATHPEPELEAALDSILKDAAKASPRRNEIAHGVVQPMGGGAAPYTYAIVPAYYATNKRDLNRAPKYAYSSSEIMDFCQKFDGLAGPAADLLMELYARHSKRPSE